MKINTSAWPYFDDYDESKGFHRILFHPSKPVQARELTQLQTILQEQIKRNGDHMFKNGTVVIPGHVFYDDKVKYLKIETIYNNTNIETYLAQLIDSTIVGDTNAIEAIVVHATASTVTDSTTLYIKYTTGSDTVKEFSSGETLTCKEISGLTFKVRPVTDFTGNGSLCTINDGVFYVNGYFVHVAKQTVTVSKYSTDASAVVGLDYVESVVTENEDESLYDNAFGFTNYGAPGAHRLRVALTLSVKPVDYTAEDTSDVSFIDLLQLKEGKIQYLKNDTKYAEIEKWLARRTFDESGDYVVEPFSFSAVDYRNNDRGAWTTNTPYLIGDVASGGSKYYLAMNTGYSGATTPSHTYGIQSDGSIYWSEIPEKKQFINNGQYTQASTDLNVHLEDEQKMYVITSPGRAYVLGFEVNIPSPSYTTTLKARDAKQINNSQLYAPVGSYVVVNTLRGMPNVSTNLTQVALKNVSDATIGTAWIRSIEYLTGDTGTPDTVEYRLFLFGISMNAGKSFERDVHAVYATTFKANVKPTLSLLSGSMAAATTTVTGTGTYFDYELEVGDRVKVGSTWAIVSSITSPTQFIATASLGTIAAGATGYWGTTELVRTGKYIAELPVTGLATIRDENGAIDTEYVISKSYSFTTTGTSYQITLTNGETFLPTEHTVVLNSGVLANDVVTDASFALNGDATQLTISGLAGTTSYKASLIVKRTGQFAKEKTKALATKTLTLIDTGTQTFKSKVISLTEADCLRLIKVTQSGAVTAGSYTEAGETDVTRSFTFDNGQREEYYDVGKITTSANFNRPLRITFEYFTHSDGDYFSIDSYATIPRAMWRPLVINGEEYFLPDCIDFRSRIADDGVDFDTTGGAAISEPLHSEHTISTSYSYYLPRKDILSLTDDGKISYKLDSIIPKGMKLADVYVAPYTFDAETEVRFSDVQIINHTMEDLDALNNRVDAVEYYVALSALEKSTAELSVKDEFGLERSKYGLLVNQFKNHEVADSKNPDYKCSIDAEEGICLPQATLEVARLMEPEGTTDAARNANGYQVTGSLVTLPYAETTLISQTVASRSENIQPYVAINFNGVLDVTPESDNWVNNVSVLHHTHTVGAPVTIVQNVEVVRVISWAEQVATAAAAEQAAINARIAAGEFQNSDGQWRRRPVRRRVGRGD